MPRGEIRFEHVTFTYGRTDGRRVLDDLDLVVRPGERVGLVGRSGAGKSTLVNLLLRFHELEQGSIRIDGQDIRNVTQESLRAAIGMVTQDTSLLHRSIAANIGYGRPGATDAEIEAAARRAQAHEFIVDLQDWKGRTGYDAHVGERGVKLSGGQRQRIAIARVILKNAPILVLDEATSALDSEVELAIQDQLLGADGRQDGDRDRAPPVDHRAHGPADRARAGPHRRGGHARRAAAPRRPLRAPVEASVGRLPAARRARNEDAAVIDDGPVDDMRAEEQPEPSTQRRADAVAGVRRTVLRKLARASRWPSLLAGCVSLTGDPRALIAGPDGHRGAGRSPCDAAVGVARAWVPATPPRPRARPRAHPPRSPGTSTRRTTPAGRRTSRASPTANDIVLLQEVTLIDPLRRHPAQRGPALGDGELVHLQGHRHRRASPPSRAPTVAHCTQRVTEPLIRLPKSSVVTWLPIRGSSKTLAVANVHSINFALTLGAYEEQFAGVAEALASHDGPIILAGDLNTWTDARVAALQNVAARLRLTEIPFEAGTLPLLRPRGRPHPRARPRPSTPAAAIAVKSSDHNPVTRGTARVALIAARAITALPYAPRRPLRTRGFHDFLPPLPRVRDPRLRIRPTPAGSPTRRLLPRRPRHRRPRRAGRTRAGTGASAAGGSEAAVKRAASEVWIYAFPLVLTDVTREAQSAGTPANTFKHRRTVPDATTTDIALPNADILYSQAWLDLSKGPVILTVPDTKGRYYLLALLDAIHERRGVDRQADDRHGEAPVRDRRAGLQGTHARGDVRGRSPTDLAWIFGRTAVSDKADVANAIKIQDQYKLAGPARARPPRRARPPPRARHRSRRSRSNRRATRSRR